MPDSKRLSFMHKPKPVVKTDMVPKGILARNCSRDNKGVHYDQNSYLADF